MTIRQPDQPHLLIVDDEKSICDILSQFLQKKNYAISVAHSGEKALEIIGSSAIDLVLTDIKMPGISGVDLLKHIKQTNRTIPVLMTTGYPTLDTAVEALKLGAFDYLTKPFHLEEISEKIKRALSNRRLEEENILFSRLVSLHEVTKILASTYQLGGLNTRFLAYSQKLSRADGGVLLFTNNSSDPLVVKSVGEGFEKEFWTNPFFVELARWAIKQEEPLVLEHSNANGPSDAPALLPQLQSCVAFPLATHKRLIGVLCVVRQKQREPFSSAELEILNVLCSQTSILIENVHLYQNIRDNYLKTIRAFALAVEAKDRYTHGHSENVMKFAVVIAKHLALPDYEIEHVKYAGLLHDIGKIGISEEILNKPGRLTDEEFAAIKSHPELGAHIIDDVPFLKALHPLVLHHHEFFDGRGYPQAISGNQIPFGARILAVADAFEAMTSDRPYRKSMSIERGMEILQEERGKQFDPAVVDAFLEILKAGYKPR